LMPGKIRVVAAFGTRPEAVKMAPLVTELASRPDWFDLHVVVTAQHREMLDQVLELFSIVPEYDLGIMRRRQSLTGILTRALTGLEAVFAKIHPDLVLVHGDTSTTLAAGLAAFYAQAKVGHVEAGLRSGDKYNPFPEEINRKLTASLADLHFAPTPRQAENLRAEGVNPGSIYITGNTVIDALLRVSQMQPPPDVGGVPWDSLAGYRVVLVEAHRRENLGDPMVEICSAIAQMVREHPDTLVVFPVHRNPSVRATVRRTLGNLDRVLLLDPVDYRTMVHLMKMSYMVMTDSGGLQEEAPALGKPVLVLRRVTERPEGLEAGTLRLAGVHRQSILDCARALLDDPDLYAQMASSKNPYGDGQAASRIVDAIAFSFGLLTSPPEPFTCGGGSR
jgi:UDP-N-acetylglucosamine 2-epimerase (non-hydrolysing)